MNKTIRLRNHEVDLLRDERLSQCLDFFSHLQKGSIRMAKCDIQWQTKLWESSLLLLLNLFVLLKFWILILVWRFFLYYTLLLISTSLSLLSSFSAGRYPEKDDRPDVFPFSSSLTLHFGYSNSVFSFCCPLFSSLYQIENLEQLHNVSQLLLVSVRIQQSLKALMKQGNT